jgi:hypothetical protein
MIDFFGFCLYLLDLIGSGVLSLLGLDKTEGGIYRAANIVAAVLVVAIGVGMSVAIICWLVAN